MRVFCVLVPGGGGPPARRPRRELPARRPRRELPARRPRRELPARRPRRELPARRPRRELRSARRLEARAASCPLAVRRAASCPFGVRAVSCPLGPPARRPRRELRSACRLEARAASFARRVVSKPALRAARSPSVRRACSPSTELVFSCLSACWRPGAAARPLAVRAASFARRVVSKPGQALPPPPGTRANTGAWLLALSRPGRIVRRGEPATEQDTPTRHGLVIGSDAPRAVFAVSA